MVSHSDPERQSDVTPDPDGPGGPAAPRDRVGEPVVVRRQVEILNALGLHMRPIERFIGLAHQFSSEIKVHSDDGKVSNGKSILEMLTLAAECGQRLDLEAQGPDAQQAIDALAALVSARFHEDDEGNLERTTP